MRFFDTGLLYRALTCFLVDGEDVSDLVRTPGVDFRVSFAAVPDALDTTRTSCGVASSPASGR